MNNKQLLLNKQVKPDCRPKKMPYGIQLKFMKQQSKNNHNNDLKDFLFAA